MLKIFGGGIIFLCCAGLGISGAWELRKHERELHMLKQAVYMLRGEIRHGRTPLPEAFRAIGERVGPPFGAFFSRLSESLLLGTGIPLGNLW